MCQSPDQKLGGCITTEELAGLLCQWLELRQALAKIDSYPPDADPDVEWRAKTALRLAAARIFFEGHPGVELLVRDLGDVTSALSEVQRGRHISRLKPKKNPGWPPLSVEVCQLRGRFGGLADYLMKPCRWREPEACKFVAEHGEIKLLVSPKAKKGGLRTVRDWRLEALSDDDSDYHRALRVGFAAQRARMEQASEELDGVGITDQAHWWVDLLNWVAEQTILQTPPC